jgi:uncharacterized membrane protein YdjX (TVP38/TMEM64 family)
MGIRKKLIFALILFLAALVGVEFVFHLENYLSFSFVQKEHEWFAQLAARSLWKMPLAYLLVFWTASACFLPITTLVTIAAGAIFGFWKGFSIALFAALSGGCLGFILARHFFRKPLQTRFHVKLQPINQELSHHGGSYVFLLRMLPGVPFALTNLLMGVSTVSIDHFLTYSFLGLFPRIALYVNAGTQVAQVTSPEDILSPVLLFSLTLLGILPICSRFVLAWFKLRKPTR